MKISKRKEMKHSNREWTSDAMEDGMRDRVRVRQKYRFSQKKETERLRETMVRQRQIHQMKEGDGKKENKHDRQCVRQKKRGMTDESFL